MKYLYVDNFRGFQDTLIPIEKVNFLIGENSTGKTSILSILNLLSSAQFWHQPEFNTDQVEMGNFKNIAGLESNKQDYFSVGFLMSESEKSGEESVLLISMKFTEVNDLPFLSEFILMDNRIEIGCLIQKKSIKYWIKNPGKFDLSPDSVKKKMKNLGKEIDDKQLKPLDNIPSNGENIIRIPLFSIITRIIIIEELEGPIIGLQLSLPELGIFPCGSLAWIAPIRSKPRRTYDRFKQTFSPEGEHSPYLIKSLLENKKTRKSFLEFIKDFGNESNLLNSIEVKSFGNDPSSPFELMVQLNEKRININYTGYGISQCLPLLVEMFSWNNSAWYAIQQPEVHLHPKAQAALGTLIYNLAISQDKNFLIETHSDYIIDRFRLNCRRKAKDKIDSQVLYFERTGQGNTVYPIAIEAGGNYSTNQPKSFRDFFVKEQMDLLELD